MRQSRVVVEALPEWLKMAVGAAFCLALPALVGWMLWSTLRGGRGIAQGLAGGPREACRALGLTLGERGALSGFAEGRFRGRAVRVSWVVGHEHGYDPSHHVTRVAAAITPPLGAGLEAVEGGTAEGIGWPEARAARGRACGRPGARAGRAGSRGEDALDLAGRTGAAHAWGRRGDRGATRRERRPGRARSRASARDGAGCSPLEGLSSRASAPPTREAGSGRHDDLHSLRVGRALLGGGL